MHQENLRDRPPRVPTLGLTSTSAQPSRARVEGKCKAQMRIIAFIQDEHSIKDIMKAQGFGRELLSARARVEGSRTDG